MNPFQIITLIVMGALGGAWTFGVPVKSEPIEPRTFSIAYGCTQVIKSEKVRYVNVPVWKIVPRAKPIPQMSQIEPKAKPTGLTRGCKRGQKEWYFNKKKKRKMFRIRKVC